MLMRDLSTKINRVIELFKIVKIFQMLNIKHLNCCFALCIFHDLGSNITQLLYIYPN